MDNAAQLPQEFAYMQDQKLTWKDLSLDSYMQREGEGNALSAENIESMDRSSLSSSQLTSITPDQIVDGLLASVITIGNPANKYIKLDGINRRFLFVEAGLPGILIGSPTPTTI